MPTETFNSNSETTWTVPDTQTLTLTLYGARGGAGNDGNPGMGGYIKVEYDAIGGETLSIWAGDNGKSPNIGNPGEGGSGWYDGGRGGASQNDGDGGGGGGCTAVVKENGTLIAAADAGAGGGSGREGVTNNGIGGGGGARGGRGGGAEGSQGHHGEGDGNGGDGTRHDGGDGGQERNRGTKIESTAGGGPDGAGYVEISYSNINPSSSVSASPNTDATVTVSWTDDSDTEDNYEIYRSTSTPVTTSDVLVATVAANTTTYTDTPPDRGTYYYAIRTVNSSESSMSTDEGSQFYVYVNHHDGSTWVRRTPKIHNGSSWVFPSSMYVHDGNGWE